MIIFEMVKFTLTICMIYTILQKTIGLKKGRDFNLYFGLPGSGKTTVAAWIVNDKNKIVNKKQKQLNKQKNQNTRYSKSLKKWIEEHKNTYSNIAIKGTYKTEKKDIGKYDIVNGDLIIDEVGIEYNNRQFSAFPKSAISYFKLHRHYKVDVHIFSQSHEDCDITLRRLAQKLYVMNRSVIPGFVTRREIGRKIGINELTHQLEDRYFWKFMGIKWIFCPTLWKLFDTEEAPKLEHKEWKIWNESTYNGRMIGDLIK